MINNMLKKRNTYYTKNRLLIIGFCKDNNNQITYAQTMRIIKNGNCSWELAYDILKKMISAGILKKVDKRKFELTKTTI